MILTRIHRAIIHQVHGHSHALMVVLREVVGDYHVLHLMHVIMAEISVYPGLT